jgi:hypothetical protein
MKKAKLKDLDAGYYLAPAVFDQRLFCRISSKPAANKHLAYETKKHKVGNFTSYHFKLPTKDLVALPENYAKLPTAKGELFNVRDQLKSPFGLINWLDNPDKTFIKNHILIQDSGGFQIAVGREEFISPACLLEAHKGIDLGVSLDIPLIAFSGRELEKDQLARLVSVTRNTNKYLENNGYKSYLNVNHGATIRERLKWLELSRKGVAHGAGLSIGGFRTSSKAYVHPKAFASAAVELIKESGYKYFHFLGATAGWQMVILSAIAARHKVVITSDSSTWVQLAISATMFDRNFNVYDVATRGSPLAKRKLNCDCFICKQVEWEYPYSQQTQLILAHNLLMMDKVAAEIKEIYQRNPSTPVDLPFAFVKEDLSGVDDYIDGTKKWKQDKLLRDINVSNGKALFGSSQSSTKAVAGALAIVDKFDEWFKKNA